MSSFFFFNDTATTEIYTLSLHDALPISVEANGQLTKADSYRSIIVAYRNGAPIRLDEVGDITDSVENTRDRKSTRLNSSHLVISYAVFCLKKKKENITTLQTSAH